MSLPALAFAAVSQGSVVGNFFVKVAESSVEVASLCFGFARGRSLLVGIAAGVWELAISTRDLEVRAGNWCRLGPSRQRECQRVRTFCLIRRGRVSNWRKPTQRAKLICPYIELGEPRARLLRRLLVVQRSALTELLTQRVGGLRRLGDRCLRDDWRRPAFRPSHRRMLSLASREVRMDPSWSFFGCNLHRLWRRPTVIQAFASLSS